MTTPADFIAATETEILTHLHEREEWIQKQSLAALDDQLEVRAFYWSLATVAAIAKKIAELDPRVLRQPQKWASLTLTAMIFNTLKMSWDSFLRGYYGVFLGQYRNLQEAELYLMAVQVDIDAARGWLDGTLRDSQAKKVVKKHPELAEEARHINFSTDKFVQATGHASHMIGVTPVTRDANSRLALRVGPFFDSQRCQYSGLLLALNAIPMAGTVIGAFCDIIPDAESWIQEFEAFSTTMHPRLNAKVDELNKEYRSSHSSSSGDEPS